MSGSAKNYYDILEIPVEASHQEIAQGYTRAKNAYSGDSLALYSLMTKEECDEILNLIEEAYSVLCDPHKRRLYNNARGLLAPPDDYKSYQERVDSNKDIGAIQQLASSGSINNRDFSAESKKGNDKKDITKIVASKRFALEHTVRPEMEQEIEQTTVFTGEVLRKIREYKGVDVARMSDMTKVSKTYIKNIEAEKLDNLPVLVYVRGFVYQYAKCLKLNPELVATSYINHIKQLKGE